MSSQKSQQHIQDALNAMGIHSKADPELARPPERFTELLAELTSGLHEPPPTMSTFPSEPSSEPVVLCALPFHSLCVHHLVPFFGTIDVAYIPHTQMVGFGSIARVIDHFARRPQVQERLVTQIAEEIQKQLSPHGVLVRCRARQMCMELRGAKKRGVLISSAAHGTLSEHSLLKQHILDEFRSAETPI